MKDPLVVDIRSTVHNNVLIYIVQITHQKYIGSYFTDTGHNFIASNGFNLPSFWASFLLLSIQSL